MNQRTNKQPQLLDKRSVLYHIKVDKNISNLKDFFGLIYALIAGFVSFRDKQYINLLVEHGVSRNEIANVFGVTQQNITTILRKPDFLHIDSPSSSPTLAASEQSADIANVPLDGSTHLSPATACAGQSTQAGDFCLANATNGKETND